MTKFTSRLRTPAQIRKQHREALRRLKLAEDKEMFDLKVPPVEPLIPISEKKLKRPVKRKSRRKVQKIDPPEPVVVEPVVEPVDEPVDEPVKEVPEIVTAEEPQQLETPDQKPVEPLVLEERPEEPLSKPKKRKRGPNAWTTFMKEFRQKPEIKKLPLAEQMKAAGSAWKQKKLAK